MGVEFVEVVNYLQVSVEGTRGTHPPVVLLTVTVASYMCFDSLCCVRDQVNDTRHWFCYKTSYSLPDTLEETAHALL